MKYQRVQETIVVNLDTGDDIHKAIEKICENENVTLGSFTGFGGISYAKLGIWNNETNQYDYLIKQGISMEMTSLTGNITLKDGKPFIHAHTTISDNEFNIFGGHLVEGTVKNLAEIFINVDQGSIDRIKKNYWYVMDI